MDREQRLEQLVKKLVFLIAKNRHWKKHWDEQHGSYNRDRLKHFENVSDKLVQSLPADEILSSNPPQIDNEDLEILKELHNATEKEQE